MLDVIKDLDVLIEITKDFLVIDVHVKTAIHVSVVQTND